MYLAAHVSNPMLRSGILFLHFPKRNEISFLSVKIATGTMEENSFSLASSMIHKFMIEMNQIPKDI